jgi:hypothetical protein
MTHTPYIGQRVELVSMDAQCQDITFALYLQHANQIPGYLIHTYSPTPAAHARLDFLRRTAHVLGGLVADQDNFRFSCGHPHLAGARRVFLEAAKLPTGPVPEPKPLHTFDKKSNRTITVISHPNGRYEVTADGPEAGKAERIEAIANGLRKLGELDANLAFPCGQSHDTLIGLLLLRALNVRAILREEESAATRGVLVAPSAQKV